MATAEQSLNQSARDRRRRRARGYVVSIAHHGSGGGDGYVNRIWEPGAGLSRLTTPSHESYVIARLLLLLGVSWIPRDEEDAVRSWANGEDYDGIAFARAVVRLQTFIETGSMPGGLVGVAA